MRRCPGCQGMVPDSATRCPLCGAGIISPFPSAVSDLDSDSDSPTIVVSPRSERLFGPLEPGTVFAGRFRVISRLGAGGMGEVYRADDLRLAQPVALKFLSPDLAANERALKLFESEVRLSREVTHPNVCRVHDIGEAEGRHFLSMEFIDGEDLASLLKRIGRLPGEKALDVARQLCEGLGAAHDRGVLHRDLKPANVMLDGRGRVRITDFGLALLAGEASQSGEISGTPHYLAPELFASRKATTRSDLYALGLVLYEIFTGKRAFEGTTFADLRNKHERTFPPRPSTLVPDLDPRIEQTIESCIKKNPEQRPASVSEILACLPVGQPVSGDTQPGNTARTGRGKPVRFLRPSWIALLAGVALLIVLGFLTGRNWLSPSTPEYVQAIAVTSFTHDRAEEVPGLLEFALTRSLGTSADFPIVTDAELALIARELRQAKPVAVVEIGGVTRGSPTGIQIDVQVRQRDETKMGRFFARGYQDLLTAQVDRIAAFVREQTEPTMWRQGTAAPFTQLCTENPDALKHFLDGERAWRKLDLANSYLFYRDAVEDDPEFTLAHLRLADVLLFRGDPRQAAREINFAVTGRARLTRPDVARMEALLARMRSDPR
ncbi:MAG: serine/threonine protein kinase, partial [Acidobacteria bacterium]